MGQGLETGLLELSVNSGLQLQCQCCRDKKWRCFFISMPISRWKWANTLGKLKFWVTFDMFSGLSDRLLLHRQNEKNMHRKCRKNYFSTNVTRSAAVNASPVHCGYTSHAELHVIVSDPGIMAAAQSDSEEEMVLANRPVAVQPYLFQPKRNQMEQPQEPVPTGREDRTANTNW